MLAESKMCIEVWNSYQECHHTVFGGWEHCDDELEDTCPNVSVRTNLIDGKCPDCVYGTPP